VSCKLDKPLLPPRLRAWILTAVKDVQEVESWSGDLLCADGGQAGQAEAVQELLLTNPRRIEQGEPGNLAFGVHRSTDNPNEFWLYETWVDEAAVQAHESGDAFQQYKETLRPLVEPESVLFGNTVPIKVLGYGPLPT